MEQARDGTVEGATSPAEGTTSRASHEVAQSARRDGHRDSAGDAQLRHLIDLVRMSGWESPSGRELLLVLRDKCQVWAPAIDRHCGLPAYTTDWAAIMTVAWEVVNTHGEKVVAANSPWAYVWRSVRNAAAVDATGASLQSAALAAQSMQKCRTLPAPIRLGLEQDVLAHLPSPADDARGEGPTDRWSPALRALLDLVVSRGGDRTLWTEAVDRAVDVIADARRSYEEYELRRDPYLRLVLGLQPEQLSALGALLIGTRRGDRAQQSLLLALHRDVTVDPADVPGTQKRLRVLVPAPAQPTIVQPASRAGGRGAA